jgi:acyl-CoA thioesterase-1
VIVKNLSIFLLILFLASCGHSVTNQDSHGATIVCFGDSLTEGVGAQQGGDYPSVLAKKVSLPVINAGIRGNTTRDALQRLQGDVLSHNPKIVIITLGANDFFQGMPKEDTLKNMEEIIKQIHAHGAMVVWAMVRIGLLEDIYTHDFVQLAHKYNIVYIPNILKGIITDPKYKSDQIHPNTQGYQIMAERIYDAIKSYAK